ncbi:MAG: hypothetical protein MI743_00170 [Sneathiellales bacterium]|nr:hypothetical protein [Sneathiellales bacterium]
MDLNWIRMKLVVKCRSVMEDCLYAVADGIGFLVAEFRIHVFPKILFFSDKIINIALRSAKYPEPERRITADSELKSVTVRLPETVSSTPKKYTYEWALARMDELEKVGVADPVEYFNNEMADWWLAPNGMMEAEADFVGIARAIEERWHH